MIIERKLFIKNIASSFHCKMKFSNFSFVLPLVYSLCRPVLTKTFSTSSKNLISVEDLKHFDAKCILSDMDGTLLNEKGVISEKSKESLTKIFKLGIPFFPATGRTRESLLDASGNIFRSLFGTSSDKIPGIFSQGLIIYGINGELLLERFLDVELIKKVELFCEENNIPVVAYAGDKIFCKKSCKYTAITEQYGDPVAEEYPAGLSKLHEININVNKLIMLHDQEVLDRIRPDAEKQLSEFVTFTSAVKGMLETLPLGASKGAGVEFFLDHYDIPREKTIALGDGENDFEMLQTVGLGIAMENAKPMLKEVAKAKTLSNKDHGVAYVLDMIASLK